MMQKRKMGTTHRLPIGVVHGRDNATDDDEASSLVQVIPGSLCRRRTRKRLQRDSAGPTKPCNALLLPTSFAQRLWSGSSWLRECQVGRRPREGLASSLLSISFSTILGDAEHGPFQGPKDLARRSIWWGESRSLAKAKAHSDPKSPSTTSPEH